ncbi:MAG: VOC family protein [Kiritimatiellae bacterium]|nr:VOC family protein [Kiritimatiellia bacterium]MDD5522617.1 VOC family protein [Kiritimatiellia bacterium]
MRAKYKHTNIVARDWRKLAEFYEKFFGCVPIPPERSNAGEWVERCTGVTGAAVRGIHLRLPGYGEDGPTLEIFQYNIAEERPVTAINRPGLAHLAFEVDNVQTAKDAVIAAGGGCVGDMVTTEIPGVGRINLVYLTDPEGNIIELQKWELYC